MMSPLRSFLVAAAFGLCSLAWSGNLVMNGGFEAVDDKNMPENWAARSWTVATQGTVQARRGGASGQRCLAITVDAGKSVYGAFSRPIDVTGTPGDRLMVTCKYRTENDPQAQVMLVSFDQDFLTTQWETRPLWDEARPLRPVSNWKTSNWFAELVPGAKQVVLVFQVLEAGTILIDDVSIRPVPDGVRLSNADIGRVERLPNTRAASFEMVSDIAAGLTVDLALTASRDGRRVSQVRRSFALRPDTPQPVKLNYAMPACDPHQVELELRDAASGDLLLNQELDVPGLIDARLVKPAFRGTVTNNHPVPEIVATGRLYGIPEVVQQCSLRARLTGTGATVTEKDGIVREPGGKFRISVPSEGLLIGEHQLRTEILVGGKVIGSLALPIQRTKPYASEVTFDEECRLLVNGAPYFPLGLYYVMASDELDAVKAAGYNTIVVPSPKASYELAEACAVKDLHFLIESPSVRRDFWELRQQKFGDMPAFIGWQVVQRPDAKLVLPDVMVALYQIIAEVSPNHPVITALRHPDTMDDYARATDIIIPWELPVPRMPITRLADAVDNARQATGNAKPVWALIQATGNSWATDRSLDDQTEGRLPTVQEIRALVYLAVIHGADGILYYATNLTSSDKQRNFNLRQDAPHLWEGISVINQELTALGTAIHGRSGRVLLPPLADGLIQVAQCSDGDQTYLVAVNTSDTATVTTFTAPGFEDTQLPVMFEDRTVSGTEPGKFGDVFQPYQVHVYRLK